MNLHHGFNYIELPSTDNAAMERFYGAAFGWTFQHWGDHYIAIHGSGVEGGIDANSGAREPSAHGPLVILYSDDLDATERAVVDAGGFVSVPRYPFPGGSRFHFTDPSGNELAVWTPT